MTEDRLARAGYDANLPPEWDFYAFTPQFDITAYELAVILSQVHGFDGLPGSLDKRVAFRRDALPAATLMRHFTREE